MLRKTLLISMVVTFPLGAMAQPVPLTGLYVGAGFGANDMMNEHFVNSTGTATHASLESRVGMIGVTSVGYALPMGLRFELEGAFRSNEFTHGRDFGFAAGAGGVEKKYGPMFNVLYDLSSFLPPTAFAPYVGVGVGYQWAKLTNFYLVGGSGFPLVRSNDRRSAIAYQAIFGGAMPIGGVPGLAMTLEYRFMGMGSRDYDVATTLAPGARTTFGKIRFGNDFNHALLIGVRYNFNQPPPPPAPAPVSAPAPAPARSYLVFFDWDKATLTDRSRQIIKEAADNSTRVQVTRIEVNGYTDTSGTPRYNQGLSVRRARAVQAELVRDGVSQDVISIQGFGDTHLLVPTGAGVREPQNRRVEIILH